MPTTKDRNEYYKSRRRELKGLNKPRVCAEQNCTTVLSRFNYNLCCHLHNFSYVRRNKLHLRLEELEAF